MSNTTSSHKRTFTRGQKAALVAGGAYTAAQTWNLIANHQCSAWIKSLDNKIYVAKQAGQFAGYDNIDVLVSTSPERPPFFGAYINCTMPFLFLFDFSCHMRHLLGGMNNSPVICNPKFTTDESIRLQQIIDTVYHALLSVTIMTTILKSPDPSVVDESDRSVLYTRPKTVSKQSVIAMEAFYSASNEDYNKDNYVQYLEELSEMTLFDSLVGRRMLASLCVDSAPLDRVSIILGYAHMPYKRPTMMCANILVIVSTKQSEELLKQRLYPPLIGFETYYDALQGVTVVPDLEIGLGGKTRFVDMKTFNCNLEPQQNEARAILRRLLLCSGGLLQPRKDAPPNEHTLYKSKLGTALLTTIVARPQGFIQRVVGEGLWHLSPRRSIFGSQIGELQESVRESINQSSQAWGPGRYTDIQTVDFDERGARNLLSAIRESSPVHD